MTDIPSGYCEDCFGNEKLKAHIRQVLDSEACQQIKCNRHEKTGVCRETIRDAVRRAIGAGYLISSNPGQKETGWMRASEAVGKIIGSSCADFSNEIATICAVTDDNYFVGELSFYTSSSCKELGEIPSSDDVMAQQYDLALWWRILCDKLRSNERYDGSVWTYMEGILRGFEALSEDIPDLIQLNHEINSSLYRVRRGRCDDTKEIGECADPGAHPYFWFSPPPKKLAPSGRMNAKGNPVYYVAFEEETAVAEVRPNSDETISVATIELANAINIIDLTAVESEEHQDKFNSLNEFNEGDYSKLMTYRFIKALSAKLTEPVKKMTEGSYCEDVHTYLETQAFAEYVKHYLVSRREVQEENLIGGVIYSSAQRRGGKCLVIFCETLLTPNGSDIDRLKRDGSNIEREQDRVDVGLRVTFESQRVVRIGDAMATYDILPSPAS